ncbi:uncharacterized protein LOC144433053 [Glandiceps talaboti]
MGQKVKFLAALILTILADTLYIISTATPHWDEYEIQVIDVYRATSNGLWIFCSKIKIGSFFISKESSCAGYTAESTHDVMYFNRFTTVISILLVTLALVVAVLAYLEKLSKAWMKAAAGTIIATAVLVLIGTIWYAVEFKPNDYTSFGYSIILAWLSVPLALTGGCLFIFVARNIKD